VSDSFSCPPEFVLFNNICYYVHSSFVYNIANGEHVCSTKYFNSTLTKFDSHDWGNVNTTRFVGRSIDDVLLEFFYYQLEKKILIEYKNDTNKKHWLRLLLGDKTDANECILRYFIRSSSAFTILHRCDSGGHPVCQCQPIQNDIPKIVTKNNSIEIDIKTEFTTAVMILSTSTNQSIVSNETIVPICDNCTNIPADEDLLNNETNTDFILLKSKKIFSYSRPFLMMVTVPLLAFVILIIGIIFLVRYVRRGRGSYSIRNRVIRPSRRPKPSSTISTDPPNPPTVLYSRLKTSPPSIKLDADMTLPFDNSIANDDHVQLLPNSINLHENLITEDEEEPLYAILKLPDEK
jgi:hypothetical protein